MNKKNLMFLAFAVALAALLTLAAGAMPCKPPQHSRDLSPTWHRR